MKKLIGLFALLMILSFAIGWSASHPPGMEIETECIVSQDINDLLMPVMENEFAIAYNTPALYHNPGDIQCREAVNHLKDNNIQSDIIYIQTGIIATIGPDTTNSPIPNNNLMSEKLNLNLIKEGLFRLDIGENVFKT